MFGFSLAERQCRPERMDQPDLDVALHHQALSGLARLNRASGICRQLWKPVKKYARDRGASTLRVLDIASGGGDISLGLWKLAQKNGIELRILGLDASITACQYASGLCRVAGDSIAFRRADVTRDELPSGFDVVLCTLFLHHLSSAQARELLTRMGAAGHLLVVSDLRRCVAGYALAQIASHLLTRSPIVGADGPDSVANAFSLAEMRELCISAGLQDARVRTAWPYRLMVTR